MAPCPDWESLGTLLESAAATPDRLEHLQGCAGCRQRLDELTALPWASAAEAAGMRREFLEELTQIVVRAATSAATQGSSPEIPGYTIQEELGRGGMGVVYRAHQVSLERTVALKVLRVGRQATRRELARFHTEATAAAQVKHPNIVSIYEVGEARTAEGPLPYIALEYVDGGTLAHVLAGQPQTPQEAARLIALLARAMQAAHEHGVIHRDLKPANILLHRPAGWAAAAPVTLAAALPKIADFGLAFRLDSDAQLTRTGEVVGTPSYMAPEQARGSKQGIGPPADIYALGTILYEALTGRPPFKAASTTETLLLVAQEVPLSAERLNPGLPRDLVTICMKCLEGDPGKRYASAAALADDLERYLKRLPILARPVSAAERLARWAGRNRLAATLGAALLVMFLVGFGMVSWKWLEANEHFESAARHSRSLALGLTAEKKLHEEIEVVSYFDKIALADREFQASNLERAGQLLAECPVKLRGWEWHYLARLCHGVPVLCDRTKSPARGAAFSPDGRWIASWSTDGLVAWDASSGKARWQAAAPGYLTCGALSPSGLWLACGDMEGNLHIWDVSRGEWSRSFRPHQSSVTCVAFSPDGHLIASGDDKMSIDVRSLSGAGQHRFDGHEKQITALAFHPHKPLLISGSADTTVKVWSLEKKSEERTLSGHTLPIGSIAFHARGRMLAAASTKADLRMPGEGTILLWDLETGELTRTLFPQSGSIHALAVSSDGRQLAAATLPGFVRRWRLPEFSELSPLRLRGAIGVAYGQNSQLAAVDATGNVSLWDAATGQEPRNLRRNGRSAVTALAIHPILPRLVFGDGRGNISVLDLETGAQHAWPQISSDSVWSVAYSPNGKLLAAGRHDGAIQLGSDDSSDPVVLKGNGGRVYGVGFAPDGKRLISASNDQRLRFWDPVTHSQIQLLAEHVRPVRGLAVAGNAARAASVALDARFWDTDSGRLLQSWMPHLEHGAACVAINRAGSILVTGGEGGDPSLRFWDAAIAKELAVGRGHQMKVAHVAFSPDETRVVSTSDDGSVRIWEPMTGRLILTLNGHQAGTTVAKFSMDGRTILSASWDGTIRAWDGSPWR